MALFAVLLFSLTLYQPTILAADSDIPYPVRMPYRIIRGATNIALGWTEIVLRPIKKHGMESLPQSLATGDNNMIIRLFAGAADVLTFWCPKKEILNLYPDGKAWPYLFQGS